MHRCASDCPQLKAILKSAVSNVASIIISSSSRSRSSSSRPSVIFDGSSISTSCFSQIHLRHPLLSRQQIKMSSQIMFGTPARVAAASRGCCHLCCNHEMLFTRAPPSLSSTWTSSSNQPLLNKTNPSPFPQGSRFHSSATVAATLSLICLLVSSLDKHIV